MLFIRGIRWIPVTWHFLPGQLSCPRVWKVDPSENSWNGVKSGKPGCCGWWQWAAAPNSVIQSPQALIWAPLDLRSGCSGLGTFIQGLFPAVHGLLTLLSTGSTQSTHTAYPKAFMCSPCVLPLRCQRNGSACLLGFINQFSRQGFDTQTKQNVLVAVSCKVAPSLHPASVRNSTSSWNRRREWISRRNPHICLENLSYLKPLFCKAIPALVAPLRPRETELLHKDVLVLLSWGKSCRMWCRDKSVP